MDTPITRAEHDEFAKRQDEENKRQNRRIDALEEMVREISSKESGEKGMVIHKNHTLVNYTKCKGLKPEWIVIHYTGNTTDTAKANTDYFKSINRGTSANYFVGNDGVYLCVNPSKGYAWHCGKDYSGGKAKYHGIVTNRNSIGIEMCSQGGRIPASHVIRHYDVCGKQCPGWEGWLPGNNVIWQKFKKDIKA